MIFDTHAHYDQVQFDDDRDLLLRQMQDHGIGRIVNIGCDLEASRRSIELAEQYDFIWAAAGVHPSDAVTKLDPAQDEENLALISEMTDHKKVAAVGEIGLDFYYGTDDREEQQELFRKQIRLANELRMPIMIHSRDAHQLTMDILKEEGAFSDERKSWFAPRKAGDREVPDARVQMHCFSGSPELALEYVKLGATMSLGGPVTFKNGKKAAEVVRQVPIEYLMSETDAPYMAPVPLRGRPNKSPYIEHIVRRMAILKGLEYEEAAQILTENGKRFFDIK